MNETQFSPAEQQHVRFHTRRWRGGRPAGAALLALALALNCAAQPQPPAEGYSGNDTDLYDGVWTARIEGLPAGYRTARVTVASFGGFWQDLTPAGTVGTKGCAGRKFPITVQRSITTEMDFMVWGSSVAPACPDLRVQLQPDGERMLVGRIGEAGTLRLTRVPPPRKRR